MRLGQLARKLALRPSDISDFLLSNNISIEEGSNAKLHDQHVVLVMQKYAPSLLEEMKRELIEERNSELPAITGDIDALFPDAVPNEDSQPASVPVQEIRVEAPIINDSPVELPAVIKAPKIALSGLKVVGKIDLPEPKKKEVPQPTEEVAENTTPPIQPRKVEGRTEYSQKRERPQQPRKNPIALQRERELEEIQQKKRIEAERKKEQRTRNYLNKVKSAPTKPLKLIKEQVEVITDDLSSPPKTWFGKFFRWLRS